MRRTFPLTVLLTTAPEGLATVIVRESALVFVGAVNWTVTVTAVVVSP
jgi:hypothetical protein